MKAIRAIPAIFLCCAVTIAGCGPAQPATGKVSGHITLDGSPIADAAVMFMPTAGRPASGVTDAQGNYRLTTFFVEDGALIGQHLVTVTKQKRPGAQELSSGAPGPVKPGDTQVYWLTPEHYSRPDKSGLDANVIAGENQFNFELITKPHDG